MKHAKGGFLTIALFALAATLLTFSVVGSAQAALQYTSATYGAQVQMQDIGVTLVENGERVSWRDYNEESNAANEQDNWSEHTGALLENMLGSDTQLKPGHRYDEVLTVRNTGKIDEYVRVSVYKYWEKYNEATGQWEKEPSLDSDLIKLHFTEGSGWRTISESTTEERTVLFYEQPLGPVNGTSEGGYATESAPFIDGVEIDDEGIEAEVTKQTTTNEAGYTVITTTYTYDNTRFVLRADVDAVQTHNADDAMRSAWGVSY